MIFKRLTIENWNQFENVSIDFHPKLTVITGANGAGKSSILRILSKFIGWQYNELSAPSNKKRIGKLYFKKMSHEKIKKITENPTIDIGEIEFTDGHISKFTVPNISDSSQALNYQMSFDSYPSFSLKGLNIPSHRIKYAYKPVSSIPVRAYTKNEAFNMFNNSLMNLSTGNWAESPSHQMKASLISLALFGGSNEFVQRDSEAHHLFIGFVEILKKLLPPTLGFHNLKITAGEVVLQTKSGDFLLDVVSGGIGAIIDLAWQIYMFESGDNEPFFVLIDEAENHLHASMQRQLLPSLMSSFPNAQFIITTHSPLMVNSVKDSSVFVLSYNEYNYVESSKLDFENKAATAAQILRDVLGVPVTMPIWVEDSLENIIKKYQTEELNAETYISLKEELSEVGLSDHLPQALGMIQGGGNS